MEAKQPDFKELKDILIAETGIEYSDEEVETYGRWLLQFYRRLAGNDEVAENAKI